MNKEEIENIKLGTSIPLLTQEEINGININMNEIINKFTKMVVKEKDLAIAQHIIQRQQEKIEELEQKETILDKVTDKLKEDMKESKEKIKYYENQYRLAKEKEDKFYMKSHHRQINRLQSRFETLREILYIVEGEENGTI